MKRLITLLTLSLLPISLLAQDEAGWTAMFNGKNLDGWKDNGDTPGCFTVNDAGELKVEGGRAHLFYAGADGKASFKNFELKGKVKNMPGSNAGIYFHTEFQEKGWPSKGYEAQVNLTHKDKRKTGSLYAIKDVHDILAKDNEWYDYYIKVEGKSITIKINGKTCTEFTEPEGYKPPKNMSGRFLDKGTFAIQAHDPKSIIFFKDFHVKALP